MFRRMVRCAAWLPPVLMLAAACGGDDGAAPGAASGTVRVFAASSLIDAFTAAGKQFESAHPGVRVTFNFGSSAALATQINEGAPADVFAAANLAQLAVVEQDRGLRAPGAVFATNTLVVVATEKSSIQSFRDLAKPGTRLVLAAKEVPAGQYAREALQKASSGGGYGEGFAAAVLANQRSDEVNVRAALTKVELGEADAAIVYSTDALAAKGVRTIAIPTEYNVRADYPIAAVKGSANPVTAEAFVAFLLSPEGQAVMKLYGFGPKP